MNAAEDNIWRTLGGIETAMKSMQELLPDINRDIAALSRRFEQSERSAQARHVEITSRIMLIEAADEAQKTRISELEGVPAKQAKARRRMIVAVGSACLTLICVVIEPVVKTIADATVNRWFPTH